MARKVFISFLGTSWYGECKYVRDQFESEKVRFIQEATLNYLHQLSPWTYDDVAYILLTNRARKQNWWDFGVENHDTHVRYKGLKSRLGESKLPIKIQPLYNIPDGNNEQEIMDIFMRLFNELQDGDELYFDITHGYRYLPMLTLVLGNYAKFLRNVTVKSITYGNYEARDKATKKAPIVDLTMLSNLQDWTHAAADFIENGSPEKMVALSESDLIPILKETEGANKDAVETRRLSRLLIPYAQDFHTCRGLNIYNATNVKPLKNQLAIVEDVMLEPMNPVMEKLREDVACFSDGASVDNCFKAAWWCFNRGLYQQAITFMEEAAITFFCLRHNIPINEPQKRELVIKSANYIKGEEDDIENECKVRDEEMPIVKMLCGDPILRNKSMIEILFAVADLRNDVNHCGFRPNPLPSKKVITNIGQYITKMEELIKTPSSHG